MRRFDQTKDDLGFSFHYNNAETDELNKRLNNNKDFTLDDLRRVALWKINRVLDIPDDLLLELREFLSEEDLSIDNVKLKPLVNRLLECSGIGMPMVSSFLKFLRPDVFPIIDVRAYRAIYGKKIYYQSYSYDTYIDYVKKVYEIRDHFKMPLSEVDQQLYCFDKEYNGKI
ncbi:hypothetical protein ACTHPF_13455 [Paenibacillus sp. SAF-054]|uniref:hypothetical protein n=1 Tax=unclassified Paenibacillus TaxID=185978 RepID=UPI003F7EA482